MCKIRVIIRDKKDGVLYDDFIELTTNLHAVERPSYVEFNQSYQYLDYSCTLTFHYSGTTEEYLEIFYENTKISYGKNSGRIKYIVTKKMRLLETDQFNLKLQIKNEPSKRIIENFSNGLTLGNSILHEIDDIIKKENFQI